MKYQVTDASVIVQWLLPQEYCPLQQKALLYREAFIEQHFSIVVPSLWCYEVGSILNRFAPRFADDLMAYCSKLGMLQVNPGRKLLHQTWELVNRYQVSFYSASYHALAQSSNLEYVTADKHYLEKLKHDPGVIDLAAW
ncbi:MAG: type II toxin-antitoxin system VapC family toxin [Gammaproteobacteria bacterium]|jgi:predicted nucleic acid-binding protein